MDYPLSLSRPAIGRLMGCILGLGFLLTTSCPAVGAPVAAVDFPRDIQPILTQSCIECHGVNKQKGGLRLDSRAAALKGGLTGSAIVPGDAAKSLLVLRIKGIGDDPQMPEKKPPLAATQIETISRWIDQGA